MIKRILLLVGMVGIGWSQSTVLNLCTQPGVASFCLSQFVNPTMVANSAFTWPASNSSGALTNNGSGVLSWTPAGAASVANGFVVTGQSAVGPPTTTVGMQEYFDPTTFQGFINIYNGSGALSELNLSASEVVTQGINIFAAQISQPTPNGPGGYTNMPPLLGTGACQDIWGNQVSYPTVYGGLPGFGGNDMEMWNTTSPLYGASPSNCGGVNPYANQQALYGVNFNGYVGSNLGFAAFGPAYSALQATVGGLAVATTLLSGNAWIMQGFGSSAALAVPCTSGCPNSAFGSYIATAHYTSGGSITGATGSYCAVGPFWLGGTQEGYGAQGYVTLTGPNTIAGGTAISFISPGSLLLQGGQLAGSAPTTAYLNNGTNAPWAGHTPASCSGTINITSTILPIYYGGLGYQSGSIYYYWNGTAYATVDLSTIGGGGYWQLSGIDLSPVSTGYRVNIGETTNTSGALLEVNGTSGFKNTINIIGASSTATALQLSDGNFFLDYDGNVSSAGGANFLGTFGVEPYRVNSIKIVDASRNAFFSTCSGCVPRTYGSIPSPAFNTTYQNTTGLSIHVYAVGFIGTTGTFMSVSHGSASPTTQSVSYGGGLAGMYVTLEMDVPNGDFYELQLIGTATGCFVIQIVYTS